MSPESLGTIADERSQLRKLLEENVELVRKVDTLELMMTDEEGRPVSNSKQARTDENDQSELLW